MRSLSSLLVLRQWPAATLAELPGRFLRSPWSLLSAILLAFVLNSYALPLTDVDEGAFSEATREMLASGNLVSPTLNNQLRHDKPILIYWAQAAAVHLLGEHEFSFRLPSLIAATLWLLAIYGFCRRHCDPPTAWVASLVMVLSLQVGLIAKAAIADALLNLFICLTLFGIYQYFCDSQLGKAARASRRLLLMTYAALALGFLTKGPVAIMFPLLIGSLFFATAGAGRAWLRALFYLPGWLLFLAIALPWHVMVYLDQGDAFFRGFYLQHNLNRYASTLEGHGGTPLYYLLALPIILLPFSGWLLAIAGKMLGAWRAGQRLRDLPRFEYFLLIWFVVVLVFFSFSRTQLPHYLLYGCTPLFILLARYRLEQAQRLLAFLPPIIFALVLALLPFGLELAAGYLVRPLEIILLEGLTAAFADASRWGLIGFFVAVVGLAFWRQVPVWQGLLLVGLLQAAVVFGIVLPKVISVTQEPVREAALLARQSATPVVSYRLYQPSFSVYRQAATPARLPLAGERVLTRADRLEELQRVLAPLQLTPIYRRGYVVLGQVDREKKHE